jgi:hypothetical protein
MSAIEQRHLLEVLQAEIDKVPEDERVDNYTKHMKEHLVTVLAFEREHRTKGSNIKENVAGQVEALAGSLIAGSWQPGNGE